MLIDYPCIIIPKAFRTEVLKREHFFYIHPLQSTYLHSAAQKNQLQILCTGLGIPMSECLSLDYLKVDLNISKKILAVQTFPHNGKQML